MTSVERSELRKVVHLCFLHMSDRETYLVRALSMLPLHSSISSVRATPTSCIKTPLNVCVAWYGYLLSSALCTNVRGAARVFEFPQTGTNLGGLRASRCVPHLPPAARSHPKLSLHVPLQNTHHTFMSLQSGCVAVTYHIHAGQADVTKRRPRSLLRPLRPH